MTSNPEEEDEGEVCISNILPFIIFGKSKKNVSVRLGNEVHTIRSIDGKYICDLGQFIKPWHTYKFVYINKKRHKLKRGGIEIDF